METPVFPFCSPSIARYGIYQINDTLRRSTSPSQTYVRSRGRRERVAARGKPTTPLLPFSTCNSFHLPGGSEILRWLLPPAISLLHPALPRALALREKRLFINVSFAVHRSAPFTTHVREQHTSTYLSSKMRRAGFPNQSRRREGKLNFSVCALRENLQVRLDSKSLMKLVRRVKKEPAE